MQPVSRHNDIFACLVAEHGHFKTLLQAFDAEYSSAKNPERLRQICAHLIHDVSSHTAFEEVCYTMNLSTRGGTCGHGPKIHMRTRPAHPRRFAHAGAHPGQDGEHAGKRGVHEV